MRTHSATKKNKSAPASGLCASDRNAPRMCLPVSRIKRATARYHTPTMFRNLWTSAHLRSWLGRGSNPSQQRIVPAEISLWHEIKGVSFIARDNHGALMCCGCNAGGQLSLRTYARVNRSTAEKFARRFFHLPRLAVSLMLEATFLGPRNPWASRLESSLSFSSSVLISRAHGFASKQRIVTPEITCVAVNSYPNDLRRPA